MAKRDFVSLLTKWDKGTLCCMFSYVAGFQPEYPAAYPVYRAPKFKIISRPFQPAGSRYSKVELSGSVLVFESLSRRASDLALPAGIACRENKRGQVFILDEFVRFSKPTIFLFSLLSCSISAATRLQLYGTPDSSMPKRTSICLDFLPLYLRHRHIFTFPAKSLSSVKTIGPAA